MKHLLAISIGPVQDFIAAARRTADLQAGSELLVSVAKTLAKTLAEQGAELIFPAPPKDDDFSKLLDGPNKLLVVTPDGVEPHDLAEQAKKMANKYIADAWGKAQAQIHSKMNGVLLAPLAAKQVETFLEFYAAWLPLEEGKYAETRCKVERLLAGRKALRNFTQPEDPTERPTENPPGRPKSPLDPSRDCVVVLKENSFRVVDASMGYPLRLKPTETLDAISLLKRVNGVCRNSLSGTPSTSEMAARAVTSIHEDAVRDAVAKLKATCNDLKKQLDIDMDMGNLMFPSRLRDELALLNRQELIKSGGRTIEAYLQEQLPHVEIQRLAILAAANARGKECPPYYAILAADGDRMGKLLTELEAVGEHVKFSRTLSEFAAWAQTCVKEYDGHPVYTGGDDVLAFVPVQNAIACAAELATKFEQRMAPFRVEKNTAAEIVANAQGANKTEKAGTLSVGIAIVHFMDNLQICVERARQAEHAAKKTRNALAVALHTRGGEAMTVADSWTETPGTQWAKFMKVMRYELGRGFPYELRELAREWRGVELDGKQLAERLQNEAMRVLKRKKGGKEGEDAPVLKLLEPLIKEAKTPADLERLAKKLVIARFLTADIPAAPASGTTPPEASNTPNAQENQKEPASV